MSTDPSEFATTPPGQNFLLNTICSSHFSTTVCFLVCWHGGLASSEHFCLKDHYFLFQASHEQTNCTSSILNFDCLPIAFKSKANQNLRRFRKQWKRSTSTSKRLPNCLLLLFHFVSGFIMMAFSILALFMCPCLKVRAVPALPQATGTQAGCCAVCHSH